MERHYCYREIIFFLLLGLVLIFTSGCEKEESFDRDNFSINSNYLSICELNPAGEYEEVFFTRDTDLVQSVIAEINTSVKTSEPSDQIDLAMPFVMIFEDGTHITFEHKDQMDTTDVFYMRIHEKWLYSMSDELVNIVYPLIPNQKYR